MFGFRKNTPASTNTSPLHSNAETNNPSTTTPARSSSEPMLMGPDDDDDDDYFGRGKPTKNRNQNKNSSNGKKDLDSMSVQELEDYAVDQAKQTTKSVDNCLKIAEDIKQDATRTLDMLHEQGEQINRTHMMAVDMDRDLSKVVVPFCDLPKFLSSSCSSFLLQFFLFPALNVSSWLCFYTFQGEKLLNSLGGMFSMPWKAKKTKEITGPVSAPGFGILSCHILDVNCLLSKMIRYQNRLI